MTLVESRYFYKLVGLIIGSVFAAIFYSINESLYVQTSLMTSNSYSSIISVLSLSLGEWLSETKTYKQFRNIAELK